MKKRGNRKDSPAFSRPFGVKLRFAALKRPIPSLNVCFSSRTGVMPSSALPRPVRRPSLRGQQRQPQRSPPVAQVLLRLRFSPPNLLSLRPVIQNLPPCLVRVVLQLIIPGSELHLVVLSSLQKSDVRLIVNTSFIVKYLDTSTE